MEAGEGETEGFDVAEADLIEHAEHGDQHGTDPIWRRRGGLRCARRRDSNPTQPDRSGWGRAVAGSNSVSPNGSGFDGTRCGPGAELGSNA